MLWMDLTNYLDDFLLIALTKFFCDWLINEFLHLCKLLGVPVALEKTEWGMSIITFLGILLDGRFQKLGIPEEKRIRTINELQLMLDRKKAMVRELQQLTGLLNFLCRAVHTGWAFTCRMYAKFSYEAKSDAIYGKDDTIKKLKPYHHVRLDQEFKEDCRVWLTFLTNKMLAVSRPFIDLQNVLDAEVLDLYTDAAKGVLLGFGGVLKKHWFFGQWEPGYISKFDLSIEYLELYAVCVSVYLWMTSIADKRIVLFCDNQSVVNMINNSSTICCNCMVLLRMLISWCMFFNCRVFAHWVKGSTNQWADLLSRQKISQFRQLPQCSQIDQWPEKLPDELWSVSKLWMR